MTTPSLFIAEPVDHPNFGNVAVALGLCRPDEYLGKVADILRRANRHVPLLLDLLPCNGRGRQQFFSVSLTPGGPARFQTLRVIDQSGALAVLAAPTPRQYESCLDMSLLPEIVQRPIRHGLAVAEIPIGVKPAESLIFLESPE